jgi:hypothetical protein
MLKKKIKKISQLAEFMSKREADFNINISLKNNYIYFETPKAACTTIKRTLMNLELEGTGFRPEKVHLPAFSTPFIKLFQLNENEALRLLNSNRMFKFCFVRNPFERVLSCYLDKIAGNKPQKKKILKYFGNDADIETLIDFDEFIHAVSLQSIKEMDKHWRPQFYQLFGGLIKFDYIGKVETFKDDLIAIDKYLKGKLLKNHENVLWHKTEAKRKIKDFYDDQIAKKVVNLYSVDFEHFGYNFNLE